MAYSTRADVYAIGLGPEAFARPPKQVEGVVLASGILQLRVHGFSADAPITLVSLGGALPSGLVEGTTYYVALVGTSSDLFRLASMPGGSAIGSYASAGGDFGIALDHGAFLDESIAAADDIIDAHTITQHGPSSARVLRPVSAFLAREIYVNAQAPANPAYAAALLTQSSWLRVRVDKLLDRWLDGMPLPAGSNDATPDIAEDAPRLVALEGRGYLDDREDARA